MEHTSAAGEWVCDKSQPSHFRYVRIFDWPKHIGNATSRESAESICFAHNAEVAALREQLEQAQFGRDEALRRENDWQMTADELRQQNIKQGAALKQKDEAMDYAASELQQHVPLNYAITVLDEARRIQPDSSALKAVIEAEPEVEALQDGGTCCICDNPITGYDSYGISDKQQHRYHWHCVRREAATVSSPTSEAETAKLREALAAARDHLEYCGYGDSWERECARESKLAEQIDAALAASAQPETSPTAATVSNETEGDTARLEWVMRKVSGGAWAAIGVWYDAGCNREAIDRARNLSPSEPSGHAVSVSAQAKSSAASAQKAGQP